MLSMDNVVLTFVGDIAFFPKYFNKEELIPKCSAIAPYLNGDIKIANFEFPVSKDKKPYFSSSNIDYLAPLESIDVLKILNCDLFSIANNHILDWGQEGVITTQNTLQNISAKVVGAGNNINEAREPIIIERKGIKFGFLAYCRRGPFSAGLNSPGSAPFDLDQTISDIIKLKHNVNHVIPLIHWGTEFSEYPYPPDRKIAHKIIDAGASCIVGHHPHVVQGLEVYNGCPIFYSLGSFIYNPFAERIFVEKKIEERLLSIVVKIYMNKNAVIEWEITPFRNNKNSLVPFALETEQKSAYVKKFNLISERIFEVDYWYYNEALDNIAKREFSTIWQMAKETKGLFLLRKVREMRARHLKIFLFSAMLKIKKLIRLIYQESKDLK